MMRTPPMDSPLGWFCAACVAIVLVTPRVQSEPAPLPPAPCVCEDIDARVAAELAAQSAAVLETSTHAAELTDTVNAMRAACFFSPASHLGVRPIRRVK